MKCKYKGFSFYGRTQSLPVRGAWIEIKSIIVQPKTKAGSLPVRGAWIEMIMGKPLDELEIVAPRAGSVD